MKNLCSSWGFQRFKSVAIYQMACSFGRKVIISPDPLVFEKSIQVTCSSILNQNFMFHTDNYHRIGSKSVLAKNVSIEKYRYGNHNNYKLSGLTLAGLYSSSHKSLFNLHGKPLLYTQQNDLVSSRQNSASPTKVILDASPNSFKPYLNLIRFDKPIGTWLLYWPCTWSISMAAQPGCLPDLRLLALFGVGAFLMRGSGCIINDMWDKDFDAKVERTKLRPLASGDLTQFKALVFLGSQLSLALAVLLQLNTYTIVLGASSMILVVLYPLAKRYTYWPQLMLGLTFNYGALIGWSAVKGTCDWAVCLPLYISCIFWTLAYDTIYAHQDKYDDMLIGVKSTALKLGEQTKPWLYGFTGAMLAGLTTAGCACDMTWPYYLGALLTTGRLSYQIYNVDLDNAEDCAKAFKGNFYLGAVMLAGILVANLLKEKPEKQEKDSKLLKSV